MSPGMIIYVCVFFIIVVFANRSQKTGKTCRYSRSASRISPISVKEQHVFFEAVEKVCKERGSAGDKRWGNALHIRYNRVVFKIDFSGYNTIVKSTALLSAHFPHLFLVYNSLFLVYNSLFLTFSTTRCFPFGYPFIPT
jgi:hypothetical protein